MELKTGNTNKLRESFTGGFKGMNLFTRLAAEIEKTSNTRISGLTVTGGSVVNGSKALICKKNKD